MAYEGDRGLRGDSAALGGKAPTDALNPGNNFFNSGITTDGLEFTAKTPDYANQLGFDAKLTRIDGILTNGASSATIALRTSSDQYLPQVITFATDLYAPVVRAFKTVANLTHPDAPTRPGDTLRYTVTYTNHGLEPATEFVADDPMPAGTTYLPGTLSIPGGAIRRARPERHRWRRPRRIPQRPAHGPLLRWRRPPQAGAARWRSARHPAIARRSASRHGSIPA